MRSSKYGNKKTIVDNVTFDSKKESVRYMELMLLQRAGKIKDLELQPKYTLQESFRDKKGVAHRAIVYIADFAFYDVEKDYKVVEDVKSKGTMTPVYKIKKKLFLKKYPEVCFYEII